MKKVKFFVSRLNRVGNVRYRTSEEEGYIIPYNGIDFRYYRAKTYDGEKVWICVEPETGCSITGGPTLSSVRLEDGMTGKRKEMYEKYVDLRDNNAKRFEELKSKFKMDLMNDGRV